MKYEKWNVHGINHAAARLLSQNGMDPLCASILSSRGIESPQQAADFLADSLSLVHDPFLLKDMEPAVNRIHQALNAHESITIYGDYDVDGITSTALLTDFLRRLGANVSTYIPDRIEEGYGLNQSAIQRLSQQGTQLIITVDCGITAVDEISLARDLGIDIVITDHHKCKEIIPDACAVVDPRRPDCPYPFKDLAGVGVALKLAIAVSEPEKRQSVLEDYLDLVAVGTVADVMLLTGENRVFVRQGLEKLKLTRRPGLSALLRETGSDTKPITTVTIGYGLAPRINAAGRMEQAALALDLLLTDNPLDGSQLALALCRLNRERQAIELNIYEQCVAILDRQPDLASPCIVLAGEKWHQGVIGIVASRLCEKYSCPTFMISLDEGKGKGSCRSFGGFNLFAALEQCSSLLEGFGGHELAAGFTILEENVPAFKDKMSRLVSAHAGNAPMASTLEIDLALEDAEFLTISSINAMSALEPFGAGNPKPVFCLSGVTIVSCADVGEGRHLKLKLRCAQQVLDAIFFSATVSAANIAPGDRVDIAFTPQINQFRGYPTVQLQLCDLHPALTRAQAEKALYEKLCSGDLLTYREASVLLPAREDFAAIWRYLIRTVSDMGLEDSSSKIHKLLARVLPSQHPHVRTAVCLNVLADRGLIVMAAQEGRLHISVNKTAGKVDLEEAPMMRRLRAALNDQEGR